jgi:hypothetical protein
MSFKPLSRRLTARPTNQVQIAVTVPMQNSFEMPAWLQCLKQVSASLCTDYIAIKIDCTEETAFPRWGTGRLTGLRTTTSLPSTLPTPPFYGGRVESVYMYIRNPSPITEPSPVLVDTINFIQAAPMCNLATEMRIFIFIFASLLWPHQEGSASSHVALSQQKCLSLHMFPRRRFDFCTRFTCR